MLAAHTGNWRWQAGAADVAATALACGQISRSTLAQLPASLSRTPHTATQNTTTTHNTDGRSSTGQVAIHAALLPGTYKVLLFGRNLPKSGPKSTAEPNVYGNVSTVYDVQSGNYRCVCEQPYA